MPVSVSSTETINAEPLNGAELTRHAAAIGFKPVSCGGNGTVAVKTDKRHALKAQLIPAGEDDNEPF